MNTPQAITKSEWEKIMRIPLIRKAWSIGKSETVASFSRRALGVKFTNPSIGLEMGAIYILSDGQPWGIITTLYQDDKQLWIGK